MFENKIKTELTQLGEFSLIDHLTRNIKITHPSTLKGVGDDAAVLDFSGKKTLTSTDLLFDKVHFDLSYTPLKHLGYKSVQVSLSDIYAMNGTPTHIMLALGMPSRSFLEAVEELYAGVLLACEQYHIDLVGGDTSVSKQGLAICVTAIGHIDEQDIVYRHTAKRGDLICVSGDLGAAYVGLQLLEHEKQVFMNNPNMQPDLEGKEYILERQLKPEARKDIIDLLKTLNIKPSSMIDISDGLSSDLLHICTQSKQGCHIYEEKIPIDSMTYDMAHALKLDPTACALHGGEDYELLFTIPQNDYEKIKKKLEISVIGHITEPEMGTQLVSKAGRTQPLRAQGWDAFKQ